MSKVSIAVLTGGWVVVGRVTQDGREYVVRDAFFVRKWGTTKGLGEIAAFGPTGTTALDDAGTVNFTEDAKIMLIDCNEEHWNDRLSR